MIKLGKTTVGRTAKFISLLGFVVVILAMPASASAAPDYTWSGAEARFTAGIPPTPIPNALNWSTGNNWAGGITPSGSVGTLTFPYLGSGCVPNPETGLYAYACYSSINDIAGISANAIDIAGGGSGAVYRIEGEPMTLGAGGITTTPDILASANTESDISMPLSLGAPQTWMINGTSYGASLHVDGDVSGGSNALQITLNAGNLTVGSDIETGPISFTGTGSVNLGAALGAYLTGALNGNDGNPVSLGAGESMFDENTNRADKNAYDLGALTLAETACSNWDSWSTAPR